jgi:hypothetical protein
VQRARLGIISLAVVATGGVAISAAADQSSRGTNTTALAKMPAGFPEARSIASFRRALQGADVVPTELADGPLLSDGVGDVRRARRAGANPVWIMPGRKASICIVSHGGLACPPAELVAEEGVAPSVFKTADGPFRTMGVAADEVTSVEVELIAGETRRAAVEGNAFFVESEVEPLGVRWTYKGKRRTFELPPDWFPPLGMTSG